MIVIFDLDDTLYPEILFVQSGFRAVANYLSERYGWDADEVYTEMIDLLDRLGRGAVFDELLRRRGQLRKETVRLCLSVYRLHKPTLTLAPEAVRCLARLAREPKYIVTDGNKVVQANKVIALGLLPYVRKAYITHRYGVAHAKPSTRCFELIAKREKVEFGQMVYIGDNPKKDFVNLRKLGVRTVRVLTGPYADFPAAEGFDAEVHIRSLDEFSLAIYE